MAKDIKDLQGTFDFTGLLTKKELKKNEDPNKNGQFTMHLYDKELDSEVKVQMWEGSEGSYWDNSSKSTIKVPKDKVATVMKEVLANATGRPFDTKLVVGGKETIYYIPNEIIAGLNKLPDKKHVLNITGTVSFRTHNNRVYKDYKVQKIEINSKKKLGFNIKVPVVISEMSKDKFRFDKNLTTVPMLVKSKLQEGGFGHRAMQLALDVKRFLDGTLVEVCSKLGKDPVAELNNAIMPSFVSSMKVHDGYVSAVLNGRLKVGEITKKPTIENLNPMELVVLQMQGEEAIKERLDGMELITEYFDSVYLHSLDLHEGKMFEPIAESVLNLPNSDNNISTPTSNPMLDAVAGLLNQASNIVEETTEDEEFNFGADVEEEKVAEVKSANADELSKLVEEQESEVTEGSDDSFNPEDFPF